jgi:hypothetical protein
MLYVGARQHGMNGLRQSSENLRIRGVVFDKGHFGRRVRHGYPCNNEGGVVMAPPRARNFITATVKDQNVPKTRQSPSGTVD